MKSIYKTSFLVILLWSIQACASVYTDENFSNYQETHKKTAIIPFKVNVTLKKLSEGVTQADITEMERDEGYVFQKKVYAQFLNRYQKGEYTVSFQDVDESNVLLNRSDINYDNMGEYTKSEIAKILGVDSVISGTISRSKPMGTGAAVASALLLGYSATNNVAINMTVHEGENGMLLWSYDHDVTGGLGSNPESMAKSLMKSISRKFPYKKK